MPSRPRPASARTAKKTPTKSARAPAPAPAPGRARAARTAVRTEKLALLAPQPVFRDTAAPAALEDPPAPPARAASKPTRGRKSRPEMITVKRIHRRDLNRVWEFLKLSFRDVNRATVEYQRPRSKQRFLETYEEEGVEQLLFTVRDQIVGYAECTYEVIGGDSWLNPRYFEKRDMRPLFVEELAVHPEWNGRGVGSFMIEQLQHLARVRGLTHLVLEVAENNEHALQWYRKRGFRKLDAAIFLAQSLEMTPELLPPRELPPPRAPAGDERGGDGARA